MFRLAKIMTNSHEADVDVFTAAISLRQRGWFHVQECEIKDEDGIIMKWYKKTKMYKTVQN